jgi:osmotically-inducible protein OsmY
MPYPMRGDDRDHDQRGVMRDEEYGYQDPRDRRDRESWRADPWRADDRSDRNDRNDRSDRRFDQRFDYQRFDYGGSDRLGDRGSNPYDRSSERDRGMFEHRSFDRDDRYRWGADRSFSDYDEGMHGQRGYPGQGGGYSAQGGRYGGSYARQGQSGSQAGDMFRMRGPYHGKGPASYQRSDERIKEMVSEALTDHDEIDATNIEVNVKAGEVTLTGTVEDRRMKRFAEECAENVRGVKDVQNLLRVGTEQKSASPTNQKSASPTSDQSQSDKRYRPS